MKALDNIEEVSVPSDYDGPVLTDELNSEWVLKLMGYLKGQKKLHLKYLLKLIGNVLNVLKAEKTLMPISVAKQITVCGDIHGQYYDLLNIF